MVRPRTIGVPALLKPALCAVLAAIACPVLAGNADGNWICGDPAGFEVLAWITVSGEQYAIDTQMGISGKGDIAYQVGVPEPVPLVVLSGPLATTFRVLGATFDAIGESPKLVVSGHEGPVMFCEPGAG